jgi:superfamily I DNA/RNA helicase
MSRVRVLLGPPGTGKTTALLGEVEKLLESGVRPAEIAFVSYTKAATMGAIDRACDRFGMDPAEFPFFRTIHSLAYQAMGERAQVMKEPEWKDFGESCNYGFSETNEAEQFALNFDGDGDCLRSIDSLARTTRETVHQAMLRCGDVPSHISPEMVRAFRKRLWDWKVETGQIDFTDMLEKALSARWKPPVRFAFVDEAQDSNKLQNDLTRAWFIENPLCEEVTYAGDDDQQIYGWSGAESGALLKLALICQNGSTLSAPDEHHRRYAENLTVLSHSWRVPKAPHAVAQRIILQNKMRIEKEYSPVDRPGHVLHADGLRAALGLLEEGSAFVLVRNNKYAKDMRDGCLAAGVHFRCENAEKSPLERKNSGGAFAAIAAWRTNSNATYSQFNSLVQCMPSTIGEEKKIILPRGVKTRAEENEEPVPLWRARDEFKLPKETLDSLTGQRPFELLQRGVSGAEREYMTRILHDGPTHRGTITITSMHRSKGLERQNVIVCSDMANRTARNRDASYVAREEENCVAYVAVTRTLGTLVVLEPTEKNYYDYGFFAGKKRSRR